MKKNTVKATPNKKYMDWLASILKPDSWRRKKIAIWNDDEWWKKKTISYIIPNIIWVSRRRQEKREEEKVEQKNSKKEKKSWCVCAHTSARLMMWMRKMMCNRSSLFSRITRKTLCEKGRESYFPHDEGKWWWRRYMEASAHVLPQPRTWRAQENDNVVLLQKKDIPIWVLYGEAYFASEQVVFQVEQNNRRS